MHELGHSLGLDHGGPYVGGPTDHARNCKVNYVSIMNYAYSGMGIPQATNSRGGHVTMAEDGSSDSESCNDDADNGENDGADDQDPDCTWGTDLNGDGAVDGFILDYSPPRFRGAIGHVGGRGAAPLATLVETAMTEPSFVFDPSDLSNQFFYNAADGKIDCATGTLQRPQDDGSCFDFFGVCHPEFPEDPTVFPNVPNSCQDGVDNELGTARKRQLNGDDDDDGTLDLGGVDWNNDGMASLMSVPIDVDALNQTNCPENLGLNATPMEGANDWDSIVYSIGASPLAMLTSNDPSFDDWNEMERRARSIVHTTNLALSNGLKCSTGSTTIDVAIDNFGPNPAAGMVLDVSLPAGVTLSAVPDGCRQTALDAFRCFHPLLEVNESYTVSLEIAVAQAGLGDHSEVLLNASHVNGPDTNESDNVSTVVLVDPATALSEQLMPVSATSSSSENSAKTASKAIDGDTNTRWSSAFSDPQWILLDLGGTKFINRVVLDWENAYSRAYQVQISESPLGPWTTIYSTTVGNGGVDDIDGLEGVGRYVRMHSTARGTQYGNSLWEFKVFGDSAACCASTDPCCGADDQLPRISATSSSNENSSKGPANAIDGNLSTRWSSAFSDPQWIYIDLGARKFVNRVAINWENAYSTRYQLQVSDVPGGPWTTLYSTTSGNGGLDNVGGLQGTGRFVRMYSTSRATQYGNSLWEMRVHGTADPQCLGPGRLVPLSAVSSSNENSAKTADKVIDGNPTTRWSSTFSSPQWIYVDLGSPHTISRVILNWESAYSSQYDIQVSSNLANPWTTIYTDNAGNGGIDDISGLNTPARYVRIYGRARATQYGHSLWELEVHGK